MTALRKDFYTRSTDNVAKDLLGKILVRRLGDELLGGIIVETEAYFGADDPSSRAFHGKKQYNSVMFGEPGHLFIYNVHRYWMLNFIAHDNVVGGILIRAIEPTMGMEIMKENRPVKRDRDLTSGPGKLTLALDVNRSLNGQAATDESCTLFVQNNKYEFEMETSHRIGVTKDLPEHFRFYVKNNRFVSK
ncbi:DNA-3-methyladenine glycosylase [Candidatus Bathyarchaeota archaeon]|jgi:DNA-3-methyladenine glycosylase|nr:DNA-3-methyladenine glycosylase [Candidatus Bathyarchaeota archaeon]MBT4319083.1 DNA-3-methyladenine glycosylase [Candidatus Bathyarchaeota archaeon]MBT4424341.1 DNA-3-methyladenine glycosylase [Candidatus Bathyarchaeota archaeon]MBT5641651.1 DNA-3-methyladenine glycosylase [Candidatus Bathyarchaeota archaeon]MBT6604671.1 DNA-3-methyladenine glycosylase [Candidatus Bathyarchaeota archaeon]